MIQIRRNAARTLLSLSFVISHFTFSAAQDTLWVRYDNRFKANQRVLLTDVDSIRFQTNSMLLLSGDGNFRTQMYSLMPQDAASMMFADPGRYLLKPDTYASTNYENAAATEGYNFAHSLESEHFAVFWDARFGSNPDRIRIGSYSCSANSVLDVAERCWQTYVGRLGFLKEGSSTTDRYKIQLYIPYQTEWRADAAGTAGVNGGKTGIGHFNPWAASARGGHTVAHEVGHTFQYLVSADLGMQHGFNYGYGSGASGGNGWWESCADWQAYKVFPERQFTDGEYFEGHLPLCHLNLMHEGWRYENCFIQDYWCMKHGEDFIGRLWRESQKPEDPVEAYQRLCGLTQEQFNDEQMEGCMRMATWDIDGIRERAAHRIGQHKTYLNQVSGTTDTWRSDVDHCIQNYGYSIVNMWTAKAGTTVKAHFKGLAGEAGWRSINVDCAGWRYAFVALMSDGQRVYGEVQALREGTAELTIPEGTCTRLFFVVMGAPTKYWRHPWDDNDANDEQWPFEVQFENTNLIGK